MKIWIVRDGEPIPSDPGDRRLMRMGLLSRVLSERGHDTVWFTSTFDHYRKHQRGLVNRTEHDGGRLTIRLIAAAGYGRNISLARIRHNRTFARKWAELAESLPKPDVLVTDIPTTEAAQAVTRFGARHGIPVVLSVRDLWPDFFPDYLPPPLRPLARLLIRPLVRQAEDATRAATSLVGISDAYLAWALQRAGRPRRELDAVFPLGYAPRVAPPEENLAAMADRLSLPPGARIASFVGSWGATYDLDLVLDTATLLAGRGDLIFVLAGDAETRPTLARRLAALPNVRLAGWLSAEEIATLLTLSAVGLLPYTANAPQGLPNKIFEYLAYGPFQVATLGGEAEALYAETQAGICCAGEPAAFAAAIETGLGRADARAQRIAAFATRFSADTIYAEMAEHIERVARDGRG